MADIEDDGFVTVYASPPLAALGGSPIAQRCADCHQKIEADGTGHLSWCPFWGDVEAPRLSPTCRLPVTTIGE
jgi:hypothetical protein